MTQEEIKAKIQQARNQGVPDEVTFKYLNDKGLIPKDKIVTAQAPVEQPQTDTYGAFFPAEKSDSPLTAGLKAAGNIPSSAYNLAKGVIKAGVNVFNPNMEKNTVVNLAKVGIGGVEKLIPGQQGAEKNFDAFTSVLKERYGSLENLQRTATNDPFGFGTDIVTTLAGGAGLVGKGAEASSAISKAGQLVTKPVIKVAEKTGQGISSTAKFATSQATGLNPETISQLINKPESFKNVASRSEITEAVKNSLDTRLQELGGLGKEYQVLRETPQVVTIPENTIQSVLNKYGVKLDGNNQILTSAESRPLSLGDKNAIQEFINNYGNERVLSSNAFLNTREALSNLSKYDASKTNLSSIISRDLRATYDEIGKTQIKGLKELDTQYAPERQLLGQLKKDIFTPQGELKDGAISKIANITGKGKENLLNRMKEIVPDIEQRVNVLKAVEDIERSSGIKVGTYARAGLGLFGATSGNIPIIIGAILAQPQIAVPLLKGYGYIGQKAGPILNAVKVIANDINNFKLPAPILNQVEKASENFKAGLSFEDVTKRIHPEDLKVMTNFIDSVRLKGKSKAPVLSNSLFSSVEKLASKFGISMDRGLNGIANDFDKIIEGRKKVTGTSVPGSIKKK